VETGNNISASLVKKEYDLLPDNEKAFAENGHHSFVDVSRTRLTILRVSSEFKTVAFKVYKYPYCIDDNRWADFIQHVLETEEFKTAVYQSAVSYSLWDNKTMLIPTALFTEDKKRDEFEFLFESTVGRTIESQNLQSSDSVGVYGIPEGIESLLSSPISNSYLHWVNTLSGEGIVAHLFVVDHHMSLTIKRDDALQISNWFEVKNADDMLYYLMATLETLNILHSEIKITLWGDVDKNDSVHSTIGRFISKISFGNRPNNLEYAYSFKDLPSHKFPFVFSTACA
jgi:hypothetical protein